MRVWVTLEVLIFLHLLSNVSWKSADAHTLRLKSTGMRKISVGADKNPANNLKGSHQRRAVTEEEISYIASTLQPKECLSLLYLLHHAYKRRRRRENAVEQRPRNRVRSAQITPCETMLLNYWRDPKSMNQKDCSHVSRTLRQVKRHDLARWLCGRRPSCPSRTVTLNGTNDASSLTAQMQVMNFRRPTYSKRPTSDRTSTESTYDSMIWVYIALAFFATTTVLFCIHCLFQKFRRSSKYIPLADKDLRNMQYTCGCIDKQLSLTCNKKKRYLQPPQTGCGCSGN